MSFQGSSDQLWDAADNDSFSKASTCYEPSNADTCAPHDDPRSWMHQMDEHFHQPLLWFKQHWGGKLPDDILKAISNSPNWKKTKDKDYEVVYRPAGSDMLYPAESLNFQMDFGKAHCVNYHQHFYEHTNQCYSQHDRFSITWQVNKSLLSVPEDPLLSLPEDPHIFLPKEYEVNSTSLQSMHKHGMASLTLSLLDDTLGESYYCQLQPDGEVRMSGNWGDMDVRRVAYKAFSHLANWKADAIVPTAQQKALAQSLHRSVMLWSWDLSAAGADPKDAEPHWRLV